MRASRTATLALLLAVAGGRPLPAQARTPGDGVSAPRFGGLRLRAALGVALGTAFSDDENGTSVRPGVAPMASVEAASAVSPATALVLSLRVVRPDARVEFASGSAIDAGGVTMVDAMLGVERAVRGALSLRGGVGLLYLRGPERVAPFRFSNDTPVRPLLELGGDVRLHTRRPLRLALHWQGFRYGAAGPPDPIEEAGLVQRLTAAVRYGQ